MYHHIVFTWKFTLESKFIERPPLREDDILIKRALCMDILRWRSKIAGVNFKCELNREDSMDLYEIFKALEKNADDEKGKSMAKYMGNQFSFLGIQTPKRREITLEYFKEAKKAKSIDWVFIDYCWDMPYREAQYIAIDYISTMKNSLVLDDVPKIKVLIQKKSWWDTVDGFHRIIGEVALKYPVMDNMMIQWSLDENLWLRRIAINHQMFRKEKTKVELFEEILSNNLGGDEFFINKAIGWALRDYSKTNPAWVAGFIRKYRDKLSKLSIKEGSKYLSIEILKLMNE